MRRLISISFILVLIVLALAACGGDEDEGPAPPPPPTATVPPTPLPTPIPTWTPSSGAISGPPAATDTTERVPQAQLRIVHASAGLPDVTVYLGALRVGSTLVQGQYNRFPYAVDVGSQVLAVYAAGDDPAEAQPLLEYPLDLEADQSLIVLLTGTADEPQIAIYEENLDPLPANTARLSVIHAVPRGAAFDFQDASRVHFRELDYGMVGGPVEVEANFRSFEFVSGPDTLAEASLSLFERNVYTLLLVPDPNVEGYQVIDLYSEARRVTQVQVIHASPDTPEVDVYLNNDLIASDLGFLDAADWESYPSQSYLLRILPAGDAEAEPLIQRQVTLPSHRAIDLVLLDSVEQLRVAQIQEDLSQTPDNGVRLTFINAAIGIPSVSIETYGGGLPGLTPVAFGAASDPTLYTEGPETFLFLTTDQDDPREVDILRDAEWLVGHAYTVVVTGYPNTDPLVLAAEVGADPLVYLGEEGLVERDNETGDRTTFELRMIDAMPDVGPLDLSIGDEPIFQGVEARTATIYTTLNPEPTTITVYDNTSGEILLADDFNWIDEEYQTLYVYRDQNGDVRYKIFPDTTVPVPGGQARLRVIHLVPYKPALRLTRQEVSAINTETENEEGTPLPPTFEEVSLAPPARFGVPTEPELISAGIYDVRIVEHETNILILTVNGMEFESGTFYDVLLLPDASGLSVSPVLIETMP